MIVINVACALGNTNEFCCLTLDQLIRRTLLSDSLALQWPFYYLAIRRERACQPPTYIKTIMVVRKYGMFFGSTVSYEDVHLLRVLHCWPTPGIVRNPGFLSLQHKWLQIHRFYRWGATHTLNHALDSQNSYFGKTAIIIYVVPRRWTTLLLICNPQSCSITQQKCHLFRSLVSFIAVIH